MDRASGRLFLWSLGVITAIAVISLAKGGLYVDRHEGDTLHLIEILRRMELGQWPHLDFSTPLGVLSFVPMAVFVWLGIGVGTSIILGQILFALILLVPIWWTCWTRLGGWVAYAVAASLIVMIMAMIHGETSSSVSMSMHYNRWAWALAILSVMLAALPPRVRGSALYDGVIIGGAMVFFIFGKVTYGVAFAPALVVALVMRKQWQVLGVGITVVAIAALGALLLGGVAFWQAYTGDLLQVRTSNVRPRAGEDWASLMIAPRFLVPNAILACGIYFLRNKDNPGLGLVLALLAPAFIYVTYQNYGNDPKWLALVAILLFAAGSSARTQVLAAVAAIAIAPSFVNMAASPIRHFLAKSEDYQAAFQQAAHDDFFTPSARVLRVQERRPGQFSDPSFATLNGTEEQNNPVTFKDVTYPECRQELGLLGFMQAVADDLNAAGLSSEDAVFTTDTFGSFWMFGDLAPAIGGAPWYYGDLSGFSDADYVLVPLCPGTPRAFRAAIKDLEMHANSLHEIRRTELYVLFEKSEG